jgi:Flp pilus assembly protein CpaB
MIATRRWALTLALLFALMAIGVLLFAMNQFRHNVAGNTQQSTVLVSTAEIQKGTSADVLASKSLYKVVPVLATQISPGAITNAGALVGKTATSTILPGEQLTAADFATPSKAVGALASPTERAVAVTLDPAHSVGGTIVAGDTVDVYGSTNAPNPTVGLLISDALVLKAPVAVSTSTTTGTGTGTSTTAASTSTGSDTFVLGTSDTLSPRIMWMFDNGRVWLELRDANATNPPATTITRGQVYLGNSTTTTPTYSPTSNGGQR